jgi:hypothetical protein
MVMSNNENTGEKNQATFLKLYQTEISFIINVPYAYNNG